MEEEEGFGAAEGNRVQISHIIKVTNAFDCETERRSFTYIKETQVKSNGAEK
jgi:hypothetical protein